MIGIDKKYYRQIKNVAKRYELKIKYTFHETEAYCHYIHVDVKNPVKDGIDFIMVSRTPMELDRIENDIVGWLTDHRPEHLRKIKIKTLFD